MKKLRENLSLVKLAEDLLSDDEEKKIIGGKTTVSPCLAVSCMCSHLGNPNDTTDSDRDIAVNATADL